VVQTNQNTILRNACLICKMKSNKIGWPSDQAMAGQGLADGSSYPCALRQPRPCPLGVSPVTRYDGATATAPPIFFVPLAPRAPVPRRRRRRRSRAHPRDADPSVVRIPARNNTCAHSGLGSGPARALSA
jgi:hypothetical protein